MLGNSLVWPQASKMVLSFDFALSEPFLPLTLFHVCIYIVCMQYIYNMYIHCMLIHVYMYIMYVYVYIFILLYFSACMDTTIQHRSTAIPARHCALQYSVDMPCVPFSLYPPYLPHRPTCTWANLLLVVYIGTGARRCAQLQLGEAVL